MSASERVELHISGPLASLRRVVAVASNTLREARRNRVFLGICAAAVALQFVALALSDLALVDQKARLVQNFGLFTIPLMCVLTAVIMGVLLLHKEIEKKTLYAILPKPIRRSEFLLGKYFGLCALLLAELLVLAVAWFVVLWLRGGELSEAILIALLLSYVEIVLITAIATFFSALSTPVLSGLFTLGLFFVGRISYIITDLMSATKGVFVEIPAMRTLGRVLVAVVPDLSTFNISDDVLLGWDVGGDYVLSATGYGLTYAAVFLVLGMLVFERRDLT
jgi:ABC-type transport system involved in multi-copper enzyme maturation permease subunit